MLKNDVMIVVVGIGMLRVSYSTCVDVERSPRSDRVDQAAWTLLSINLVILFETSTHSFEMYASAYIGALFIALEVKFEIIWRLILAGTDLWRSNWSWWSMWLNGRKASSNIVVMDNGSLYIAPRYGFGESLYFIVM